MGFFEKLKQGLSKTASSISSVFTASELDDDFYDDLEESLIVSDLGMDTTETVMDRLRQTVREQHIKTVDEAKIALRAILADMLNVGDSGLRLDTKPSVILVIGVNGVGKTTTIGKLAHQLRDQGKKVLLCAGDTFRAAAADQLEIWSERAHCDIIRQHEGADPASVVYDAIAAAKARAAHAHPAGGCPSAAARTLRPASAPAGEARMESQLVNWPVQIQLLPLRAPYLQGADVLIAADCTAFAYANLHADFLRGRVTLIGCPKLDGVDYAEKLAQVFLQNEIRSVTVLRMEVPCCGGLTAAVERALTASGRGIPLTVRIVGIDGTLR